MCVRTGPRTLSQRLVGFVPLLGFIAIEFCRPGSWRHVWLVVEMVLLCVVIGLMVAERRRNRERRS
jgi:uncharacterized membrane protein